MTPDISNVLSTISPELMNTTSTERGILLDRMLLYNYQNKEDNKNQIIHSLVETNSNILYELSQKQLSVEQLISQSDLDQNDKNILLIYCKDLQFLTARGAAGPLPTMDKPTVKEQKIFSDSIKMWTALIAAISGLSVAFSSCEANHINENQYRIQNEQKNRELDQKDRELEQRDRELDIEKSNNLLKKQTKKFL